VFVHLFFIFALKRTNIVVKKRQRSIKSRMSVSDTSSPSVSSVMHYSKQVLFSQHQKERLKDIIVIVISVGRDHDDGKVFEGESVAKETTHSMCLS
jgi:predicted ATP-binding protein involved in virulence